MNFRMLAAAVLGATLLAAGPALADPRHCPPGHAKKGWCTPARDRGYAPDWRRDHDDRDRWQDDAYDRHRLDEARDRAYEEGYRDGRRDAWRVGERLPRDRYRQIPDWWQYGWSRPGQGAGYVLADNRYYLVNLATGIILDVLSR